MAKIPAIVLPERPASEIAAQQENVALRDALFAQSSKTSKSQCFTNAQLAVCCSNGEVMEIPASAVMTGKNSPDDHVLNLRHETEPGITFQVAGDAGRESLSSSSPIPEIPRHKETTAS